MRVNLKVFKGKPVLYGGAFIVFFIVVLHFINKNAGASGGDTVVTNGGPSDAQIAAGVQMGMASLQAQTELAGTQAQLEAVRIQTDAQREQANLAASLALATAHIGADSAALDTKASLEALHLQLDNAVTMNEDNNAFQIGYSRLAYDAATAQTVVNAQLTRDLSAQQLKAFQTSSFLSAIGMFKKKGAKLAIANLAAGAAGLAPNLAPASALPSNSSSMI